MHVLILNLRLCFSRNPVDVRFWMSCRISDRGFDRSIDRIIRQKAPVIRSGSRWKLAVSRAPPG